MARNIVEDANIDGFEDRSRSALMLRGAGVGVLCTALGLVGLSLTSPLPDHLPTGSDVRVLSGDAEASETPAPSEAETSEAAETEAADVQPTPSADDTQPTSSEVASDKPADEAQSPQTAETTDTAETVEATSETVEAEEVTEQASSSTASDEPTEPVEASTSDETAVAESAEISEPATTSETEPDQDSTTGAQTENPAPELADAAETATASEAQPTADTEDSAEASTETVAAEENQPTIEAADASSSETSENATTEEATSTEASTEGADEPSETDVAASQDDAQPELALAQDVETESAPASDDTQASTQSGVTERRARRRRIGHSDDDPIFKLVPDDEGAETQTADVGTTEDNAVESDAPQVDVTDADAAESSAEEDSASNESVAEDDAANESAAEEETTAENTPADSTAEVDASTDAASTDVASEEDASQESASQDESLGEGTEIAALTPSGVKAPQEEAPLPVIALDGAALDVNGRSYDAPADAPLLAVILEDAASGEISEEMLPLLTMPLTFAIRPDQEGSRAFAAAARAANHEVLSELPIEPLSGSQSAGDLRIDMTPDEIRAQTIRYMAELDMAVGATAPESTHSSSDLALMDTVLNTIHQHGFAYVDFRSGLGGVARRIASETGVPYVHSNRFVPAGTSGDQIYQMLESAAFRARREGTAVLVISGEPTALQALLRWGLERDRRPVWFAPISAVIERRAAKN